MEFLLSLSIGIGLSAACGFRVFIPLLIMGISAKTGHLTLYSNFAWIGSNIAILTLSVATVVEVIGYFIPWVDNLLDTIASPAAVIAGTIATASCISEVSPYLRWMLAIIAGGGISAIIQTSTVALRGTSSVTTAGTGNSVIAIGEGIGAVIISILAVVLPIVTIVFIILIVVLLIYFIKKIRRKKLFYKI